MRSQLNSKMILIGAALVGSPMAASVCWMNRPFVEQRMFVANAVVSYQESPETANRIVEMRLERSRHQPQAGSRGEPRADGAAGGGALAYNRSIDSIGFRPIAGAPPTAVAIDVLYSLDVGNVPPDIVLEADILLEILVDDVVVMQMINFGQFDFASNDAITCAVSCSSACGSIFGDGTCSGCNCSYSRVATFFLTSNAPQAGHVVRASIIPLPGTAEDVYTNDDVLEVIFGNSTPIVCPADLNFDGIVNVFDLLLLLSAWGPCP